MKKLKTFNFQRSTDDDRRRLIAIGHLGNLEMKFISFMFCLKTQLILTEYRN